ncbi:MAG: hypothetical protein Q9169_003351 [Polycauliona sp. 2 TL-2023]
MARPPHRSVGRDPGPGMYKEEPAPVADPSRRRSLTLDRSRRFPVSRFMVYIFKRLYTLRWHQTFVSRQVLSLLLSISLLIILTRIHQVRFLHVCSSRDPRALYINYITQTPHISRLVLSLLRTQIPTVFLCSIKPLTISPNLVLSAIRRTRTIPNRVPTEPQSRPSTLLVPQQMQQPMYGYPQYQAPMNQNYPAAYAQHAGQQQPQPQQQPPTQPHSTMTSQPHMMMPHQQQPQQQQPPPMQHQQPTSMQHQQPHPQPPEMATNSPRTKLEPPAIQQRPLDANALPQRPTPGPISSGHNAQSSSQTNGHLNSGQAGRNGSASANGGAANGQNPNAAPGPIPATTPTVVRQDQNGVQWIAFEYSRDRVKMEYTIRCDVESVNVDQLAQEFKTENCVYPRANCIKDQYRGNRLSYETECNTVGWALAELNPCLRGKRGLIQRAVDSWRNSNQDPRLRSRRVRRQAKIQTRKQVQAPHPSQLSGPGGPGLGSGGAEAAGVTPGPTPMAAPVQRPQPPSNLMMGSSSSSRTHHHHAHPDGSAPGGSDEATRVVICLIYEEFDALLFMRRTRMGLIHMYRGYGYKYTLLYHMHKLDHVYCSRLPLHVSLALLVFAPRHVKANVFWGLPIANGNFTPQQRQHQSLPKQVSPNDVRQHQVFHGYPHYPTQAGPGGIALTPSLHDGIDGPLSTHPHVHPSNPSTVVASIPMNAKLEDGNHDDQSKGSRAPSTGSTNVFGDLPEAKRRKFISVEDLDGNRPRARIRATLDTVDTSEIPDSYRKANSVYPRSYFPVYMQSPKRRGSRGNRFFEDDEPDGGKGGGGEPGESEADEEAVMGRTLVPVPMMDGHEGELAVPKIGRAKRRREEQINDLGYRMAWQQSRAFAPQRTLFLQRALDIYREKTRTQLMAGGQPVAAHLETRIGKRKWLARKGKARMKSEG